MERPPFFQVTTTLMLMVFGLHGTVVLASADETFRSAGFARAPEGAFDIVNASASLFRDPVFNGAADLSVVWHVTQIRAFGRNWDYLADRKPDGIQLTIVAGEKTIYQTTKPEGREHVVKLP